MRKLAVVVVMVLGLYASSGREARAGAGHVALLDVVPEGALLAGALHSSALELMRSYFAHQPDLQRDLSTFFIQRIGVDVTRIDGVTFWSTQLGAQPSFAAFVRVQQTPPPQIKGTPHGSYDGVDLVAVEKLVAATVPGGFLIGEESDVRAGIAVAHHHSPALAAGSPLGVLLSQSGADLLVGLAASAIREPSAQTAIAQYGVNIVTLVFGGDGKVVLQILGDGAKLKNLNALAEAGMVLLMGQLKIAHDRGLSDPSMELTAALGGILGYDQLQAFWKEAAPRLEGDKLVSRYTLPQIKTSGMIVPMLGIMAATAIPGFVKYTRRSKTVEATMNVRKLAEAAASYAESASPKQKARFAFPRSTAWTPAAPCCPQPGGKCAPDAKLWRDPTFRALNFSVDDPFYYQYRVTSEGRGPKARVTVEARGDLDCNQVTSSFKRTVTVDGQGKATVGPLDSANDTE